MHAGSWQQSPFILTKYTGWSASSISLKDERLAVGAYWLDEVEVYTKTSTVWQLDHVFQGPTSLPNDPKYFGVAVGLGNKHLVVAAPRDEVQGALEHSGAAHIYRIRP